MVLTTASLYFSFLAFGCLAPLPLVRLQEVGQGFYRFFGYTCVTLEVLALGMAFWMEEGTFQRPYFILSGVFLVSMLAFTVSLRVRNRWLLWGLFAAAVLSGLAAVAVQPWGPALFNGRDSAGVPLLGLHALLSSLVMGFATLAMMLGHWYLVTPRLSITPLKRFAGGYILLSLLVAVELAAVYLAFVGTSWSAPATALGVELKKEFLFALFRMVWGVLAPLGMAYWIWETVRIKSTQSATGILYAAMVCTLIGEGIGLFLTLQTGVPF